MAKFKLGQEVSITGLDGCVITGVLEREGGFYYEVKSVSTEALYPEKDINPDEVVPEEPKHYSEVEEIEDEGLEPMTSEDI